MTFVARPFDIAAVDNDADLKFAAALGIFIPPAELDAHTLSVSASATRASANSAIVVPSRNSFARRSTERSRTWVEEISTTPPAHGGQKLPVLITNNPPGAWVTPRRCVCPMTKTFAGRLWRFSNEAARAGASFHAFSTCKILKGGQMVSEANPRAYLRGFRSD